MKVARLLRSTVSLAGINSGLAPLPRESQQSHPGRRLPRPWSSGSVTEGKGQTENHPRSTPAASSCSQWFNSDGPDPLLIPMPTCPTGSDDVQLQMRETRVGTWRARRDSNPQPSDPKTNISFSARVGAVANIRPNGLGKQYVNTAKARDTGDADGGESSLGV